jgi:hypothetical protein
LLQADFLLQASREEVIIDSSWNKTIINQIAEEFCNAMDDFSTKPSLRFCWMRFLPNETSFSMNSLWHDFSTRVKNKLKDGPVLHPHDSTEQYLSELRLQPRELRTLPETYLDRDGSPLFADLPGRNRRYLSLRYEPRDVEVLKSAFNLRDIEDVRMVRRIKQDLDNPNSVMRDSNTDSHWHTLAANLITTLAARNEGVKNMIKHELPLIPLGAGGWVTASTRDLRFPSTNGPAIPQDLVTTIHPDVVSNGSRRAMFEELGVTRIEPESTIGRIWMFYSQPNRVSTLDISKAHLSYLYWHYDNGRTSNSQISRLWLYDANENKVTCDSARTIYMPDDDEYGPRELLKSVRDPRNVNRFVPECPVQFLHTDYLNLFSQSTRRHGSTWQQWLQTALGVRRNLRLKYHAGSLSAEFRHLLRYRPEKIVKVLKMDWLLTYRREMSTSIVEEISQAEVVCLNSVQAVLSTTYFPLPILTQKATELRIAQAFPFIKIPDLTEDEREFDDWRFLDIFGVKFQADLTFYMDILRQHKADNRATWNSDTRSGIIKTYELIAEYVSEATRPTVM